MWLIQGGGFDDGVPWERLRKEGGASTRLPFLQSKEDGGKEIMRGLMPELMMFSSLASKRGECLKATISQA